MSNTYIIVENQTDWASYYQSEQVLTFAEYLSHQYQSQRIDTKKRNARLRIINLCKSHDYLSIGYYCSLLAEARGHSVIPSIRTLNDLSQRDLTDLQLSFIPALFPQKSKTDKPQNVEQSISLLCYFGTSELPEYQVLAQKVFEHFPCPILRISIVYKDIWQVQAIETISPDELTDTQEDAFANALDVFSGKIWRSKQHNKQYRFDLAILVNPEEKLPPSDKKALKKFISAGRAMGIDCELITEKDYLRLPEFDGLFIRTTTAIDNFSYRFAKRAELEGLVVIDDPTSILRCTNKIYLADLFKTNKVSAPKTELLRIGEPEKLDALEQALGYPIVLKIPDGAFSLGVEKVKDRPELEQALARLFKRSSLLLAQEFLYTEYDWRIGVLNHKPIYACRYYMVRNHWQIYNHGGKRVASGGFETLPTFEVPKAVIEAAIKATKPIGNGLYGVDIKEKNHLGYVIEVNDNPSLDSDVEDLYLGDELYRIVMAEFLRRMELRGNPKS
jgi:glutathione synthase/RimK-type ligase-like ATP-grasp enzyme